MPTDGNGQVTFTLAPGVYTVHVEAPVGFQPVPDRDATVTDGQTTVVSVVLQPVPVPQGVLSVSVHDAAGNPQHDVIVTVTLRVP